MIDNELERIGKLVKELAKNKIFVLHNNVKLICKPNLKMLKSEL